MSLKHTINAILHPGDGLGYVAECIELPIVTQGATKDEALDNLHEAVSLYLEGENLKTLGLTKNPTLVVTTALGSANV